MVSILEKKQRIAPTVMVTPEAVPAPEKLYDCEVPPTAPLQKMRTDYSELSNRLHKVTEIGMNVWSGVISEAGGRPVGVPEAAKEALKAQYRAAYGLPADHEIDLTVRFANDERIVFGPTDVKHERMLAAYEIGQNSLQKVSNSVTLKSLGIDSCVEDLKR